MSKKLKIAVAGAGLIGKAHIEVLQKSSEAELCAIVDPSDASKSIAASAECAWFSSLEDLIKQAKPDAVVLATPNVLHVPQALQCLEAGLPVLLEKPIAPTLTEAEKLVAACEQLQGKLLIGHHRAHSPIMAASRAVVQSGKLGRLVAVQGSACFFKPDHYFVEGAWRTKKGGGPILLNMIHEVHNLRMLCGEIVAVQAIKSHAVRGYEVEDTVAINFQFASGVLGSFLISDTAASARSWEQTSQENKSYPTYEDEDCYVISGTNGSLAVPTMRLKTYARHEDRSWWKPFDCSVAQMQRGDPLKHQMAHFCAVIRGESEPLVSARDGLANLRVTEAIVQAAQSGQLVQIH